MKILYMDKPSLSSQIRIQTIEENTLATVERATSLGDVHILYKKEKYDLFLLDHALEGALEAVQYINTVNPKQKILTISDAKYCLYSSCEECVAKHQSRRLNNPTTMQNILRFIHKFSEYNCDHYKTATNLNIEQNVEQIACL